MSAPGRIRPSALDLLRTFASNPDDLGGGISAWRWPDPAEITGLGATLRLLVAVGVPPAILTLVYRLLREPDGLDLMPSYWAQQAVLLLIGLALYIPGIVAVAPLFRSLCAATAFAVFYMLAVTAFLFGFSAYMGGI